MPAGIQAKALRVAAQLAPDRGDLHLAITYLEEALVLVRQTGDKSLTANILSQLGYMLLEQGSHVRARVLFEESLVLDRELGDTYGVCWLDTALSELARLAGLLLT